MADILVVVTCRDNGRTLERALEDLREQGRPDASCVVLDFGSTDLYTRALLGKLRCRGVPVHDGGDGAHPLFTSAAGAQPDYVMVMRGDTRLSPGFLAAAADCLERRQRLSLRLGDTVVPCNVKRRTAAGVARRTAGLGHRSLGRTDAARSMGRDRRARRHAAADTRSLRPDARLRPFRCGASGRLPPGGSRPRDIGRPRDDEPDLCEADGHDRAGRQRVARGQTRRPCGAATGAGRRP